MGRLYNSIWGLTFFVRPNWAVTANASKMRGKRFVKPSNRQRYININNAIGRFSHCGNDYTPVNVLFRHYTGAKTLRTTTDFLISIFDFSAPTLRKLSLELI
jgi:hypothetical protein